MCPPLGFRIVLTISAINSWIIVRANVKAAFLNTGEASHDVNVRLRRESEDRRHYWLLLAALYGLVNSNAEFQTQTDEILLVLSLISATVVTQLFHFKSNGKLILLVARTVDVLLITGVTSYVDDFLVKFNKIFQFGSVVCDPGYLKFYGMKIVHNDSFCRRPTLSTSLICSKVPLYIVFEFVKQTQHVLMLKSRRLRLSIHLLVGLVSLPRHCACFTHRA